MTRERKSCTVWLNPRHVQMLSQMPGISIGEISRKAVEESFEGRNDREFARISMEEDLADLAAEWERTMGVVTSVTVTSTADGFRVVMVGLKQFDD